MERTNIDTHHLRQVLDQFSAELETGFLERRADAHAHKDDLFEELAEVIKEVTDREKQLQAAVGIARMLLDNDEIRVQKLDSCKLKRQEIKFLNQRLQIEINSFREDFEKS